MLLILSFSSQFLNIRTLSSSPEQGRVIASCPKKPLTSASIRARLSLTSKYQLSWLTSGILRRLVCLLLLQRPRLDKLPSEDLQFSFQIPSYTHTPLDPAPEFLPQSSSAAEPSLDPWLAVHSYPGIFNFDSRFLNKQLAVH